MKKIFFCLSLVIFSHIAFGQVLAVVNGKFITLELLKQELAKLPLAEQKNYETDYSGFLEELINQELLMDEAIRQKIDTIGEVKTRIEQNDSSMRREILINELLNKAVRAGIKVGEDEMVAYFKENPKTMKGLTYPEAKPQIFQTLHMQKESEAIKRYIADLRTKADIFYNENLLISKSNKTDPIKSALKNKLPTMVEFGGCYSAVCERMKPVIAGLQSEYKDKANILILDYEQYKTLTQNYQIKLVPTLIFFDNQGNETFRHTGFFSKDSILIQIQNAGLK